MIATNTQLLCMVYVMKGSRQEHFVVSVVQTTQMLALKISLKLY